MLQNRTYDTLLEMKDAGLVAASAAWEVDSATKIIDLGGNGAGGVVVGHNNDQQPIMNGDLIIDVSAIEIGTGDEAYTLHLTASPDADFGTAANIVELFSFHLGADGTKLSDSDADDTTGRYILPFRNERGGTVYRYLRGYTTVAGTIATGINFTARLGLRF